jgi:gliding motility-associated-like protein
MKNLFLIFCLIGSVAIFAQPLPITNIDIEPERCGRDDGSFSVTHGGQAPFDYFLDAVQIAGPSANNLNQGMYTFRVVDALGRSKDTLIVIPELFAPVLTLDSTTFATCSEGGSAWISSSDPTATATWNSVPTQSGFTLENVPSGSYTVNVTDSAGCSSSLMVRIDGIPPPDLDFVSTPDTCGAGNGTAAVIITGNGTAPFSFRWNNDDTDSLIRGLAVGTYEVEVIDANGCRGTGRIQVELFSDLEVTANITRTSCFGGDDGRIAVTVTGGNGQYSYEWSPDVSNEAVAEGLEAGQYTVTVTDLQGQDGGCIAVETFEVGQPNEIRINARVEDASGCRKPDAKLWVEPQFTQGPYVVTWDTLFPQAGNFTPLEGDTANNILPGLYTVRIVDSAGCEASTRVIAPNKDNIDLRMEILKEDICGLGEGVVNAIVTGGVRPIRYNWFTFPSQNVFDPFARNLPAGTFSVVATDDSGCVAQQTFTMTGNERVALDTAIVQPDYCELGNGTARVIFTGGEEPYTYQWSSSPVQTDGLATDLPAGYYRVLMRDVNNCRDTVSVYVPDEIGFTLEADASVESCYRRNDGSARASALGASSPVSYQWSTDPPSFGTTLRGLPPGSYQVTATDAQGCSRAAIVDVGAAEPLIADFSFSPDTMMPMLLGEATISFLDRSVGAEIWEWNFGDGETSREQKPVHSYRDTGRFDVTLVTRRYFNRCVDSISFGKFLVTDPRKVWVPSAFSPNDDAFNDRLEFFTVNLQSFDFQIYNRWGRLVFQANDPGSFWDGNTPEGSAPEGVYVYILNAIGPGGERIEQRGTITLIR